MTNYYKDIDQVHFLLAINEPIKKVSHHYYRHEFHDSLVIDTQKNYFHWNSQNVSGGVIQYLMAMKGMSKAKAMSFIHDTQRESSYVTYQPKREPPQPFHYKQEDERPVPSFPYLEKRGISPHLIQTLYNQDLIAYNRHDQVVFKWYDKAQFVGCSLQGTTPLPPHLQKKYARTFYKQIHKNSPGDWGFNLTVGRPKKLLVFESPLDLISYINYDKERVMDSKCVSLEGLKKNTLLNFITKESKLHKLETICLCVDNDSSGLAFVNQFKQYKNFLTDLPTKKDWNEQLLAKNSQRLVGIER